MVKESKLSFISYKDRDRGVHVNKPSKEQILIFKSKDAAKSHNEGGLKSCASFL